MTQISPADSSHVRIRPYTEADEAALSAAIARSLDHLRPWVPFADREPLTVAERLRWIRQTRWEHQSGGDRNFGIFDADGALLGGCGLHDRIGPRAREVGYWVAVEQARRGIATEAVRQLVELAFAEPSMDRLEIHHDAENPASGRVAAKNGFSRAGERREAGRTLLIWERRR